MEFNIGFSRGKLPTLKFLLVILVAATSITIWFAGGVGISNAAIAAFGQTICIYKVFSAVFTNSCPLEFGFSSTNSNTNTGSMPFGIFGTTTSMCLHLS